MLLDGEVPLAGQIMKFPDLAKTFRSVAEQGKDGFYKGGVMELDDLAEHETTIVEPISYTYGGEVTVYESRCLPNSQGIPALLALGIIDGIQELGITGPVQDMEHDSPEYLHLFVECLRLAFADSQYYVADPDIEHVPVKELLSNACQMTRGTTSYHETHLDFRNV